MRIHMIRNDIIDLSETYDFYIQDLQNLLQKMQNPKRITKMFPKLRYKQIDYAIQYF